MMPADETKSRMITIRITAEELDRIQTICKRNGIHNLSEFARAAIHRELEGLDGSQAPPSPTELRFREVFGRLCSLEQRYQGILDARKERK